MACKVNNIKEKFYLMKSSSHSGWGAKLGAGALDRLLKDFPHYTDNNLLVWFSTDDDAGVYKINDETALIPTIDFFPPISDDAYLFGQIATSNALSDIYAMGGQPKLALNLLCITNQMPDSIIKNILRGGDDKIHEAGAIICGGIVFMMTVLNMD